MTELPSWLITGFKALGGSTVVLGLLWLIGKRMDQHRPPHEVMGEITESLRETIEHQAQQIHALEKDVRALREEVRKASIRSHFLYVTIQNYIIDYPHAGQWFAERLAKMEAI